MCFTPIILQKKPILGSKLDTELRKSYYLIMKYGTL